jgi:hypothetical protein
MLATAIVAASGVLEISCQPVFAAAGHVALDLAAVRFEAEKLRLKINRATRLTSKLRSGAAVLKTSPHSPVTLRDSA